MRRKELRHQAVMELMRENNERIKEGQNHNPYWCHESLVKERMKQIRARPKGPPAGMRPLANT
jgi:hypothetical protein